ncbi:DUF1835 domain-containing protein [Stutzerimonas azotifigens]|uniref:DUF1835 domain-containing protein n=1 Tax=Stutzerimonas azotifigens TaxID=291995 RepID=A0ABR5Z6D1_9GAMM|nr:DUF1835 domain-containing protein [Stutzerimonas azotifigens]MBA1275774.1 DUF1835 domain-containing protein [Stutzerimonas azotifigens]
MIPAGWHLTCGDLAAESVAIVTAGQPDMKVRVMRDDLAVGPLRDVDAERCPARAWFWEAVWPGGAEPRPDFANDLAGDARWLAELPGQGLGVTVWHGDSASEQLLLARVCAALEGSPLPLFEVACGTGDSRVGTRMAVSMHRPAALAERIRPQRIDAARQRQLAAQWRGAVAADADIRRWREGQFFGERFDAIDAQLVAATEPDWRPLARAMAEVMRHCDGFFPTDYFLYWRARELARGGRLELDGVPGAQYSALQVRRAASA